MIYFSDAQHEQFDKALNAYAAGKPRGCFELEEAAQDIANSIECEAGQEKDLLERVRSMLRDDFRVFEKDRHCALRSKFFDGARIKIVPTGFELENGILLHGDRFEALVATHLNIGPRHVSLRDIDAAYSIAFPDATPINVNKKRKHQRCSVAVLQIKMGLHKSQFTQVSQVCQHTVIQSPVGA